VASGAVLAVIAVGGLVIAAVLSAQGAGRTRLGQLQVAQVSQLARSMDTRIEQALTGLGGLLTPPYHATVRDPQAKQRLDQLQALNPKATTGYYITDKTGMITNGTLLRDPSTIGTVANREGIAGVLAGTSALLPVGQSLTTALPTLAIAYPLKTAGG